MRGPGWSASTPNRAFRVGPTWLPRPSTKRPSEPALRSQAVAAVTVGERAKATATLVPTWTRSVASRAAAAVLDQHVALGGRARLPAVGADLHPGQPVAPAVGDPVRLLDRQEAGLLPMAAPPVGGVEGDEVPVPEGLQVGWHALAGDVD